MITNQRSTWYNFHSPDLVGGPHQILQESHQDRCKDLVRPSRQVQRPGHQDRCNLLTFTVCIPDLAGGRHQILGDEPIYLLSANPWVLEGTQFRCKIIWGSLETESEKESYFLQKWDLKFSRFQIRCYINIRKSDLLRNTLLGGNYQWKELQSLVLVFRSAQSNMANAKRQWWWCDGDDDVAAADADGGDDGEDAWQSCCCPWQGQNLPVGGKDHHQYSRGEIRQQGNTDSENWKRK